MNMETDAEIPDQTYEPISENDGEGNITDLA